MIKGAFLLLFLAVILPVSGQTPAPVFASRQDSVAYFDLLQQIASILQNPQDQAVKRKADSLFKIQAAFIKKLGIGSNKGFTTYGELVKGKDPKGITRLNISDYPGTELPDSMYQCTNLTELLLVNCRIRKIPSQISSLPKLRKITSQNNDPATRLKLSKNNSFEVLVIHGDVHNRLPSSYARLKGLKTLDLSRNSLVEFPKLGRSPVQTLNLSDNNLTLGKLGHF